MATNGHGPQLLHPPPAARLDRVRVFAFAIDFMAMMLGGTGDYAYRYRQSVPDGSDILGMSVAPLNGKPHVVLVIHHPSFPVVLTQPPIEFGSFDVVLAPATEAGEENGEGGTNTPHEEESD